MKSNKSVYQENSVYNNDLFLCLNELAQGTLAWLCLFEAIPVETSSQEGAQNVKINQ
jgi:hypothetical protein